jgi:hypothetical protein
MTHAAYVREEFYPADKEEVARGTTFPHPPQRGAFPILYPVLVAKGQQSSNSAIGRAAHRQRPNACKSNDDCANALHAALPEAHDQPSHLPAPRRP